MGKNIGERGERVGALKVGALVVPPDVYLALHSLANSAVPSDYNIIPEAGCVGKIDVYKGEQLRWWLCERGGGEVEVLTPGGDVVAVVTADDRLYVLGNEVGPYDIVAALGVNYRPVYGHQVVLAARQVLAWVHSLQPPLQP